MNQEMPQMDTNQPAPKERLVDMDKITPHRMKENWDKFNSLEQKLIVESSDTDFREMVGSMDGGEARKWILFRQLIKSKSRLASLINLELHSKQKTAGKDTARQVVNKGPLDIASGAEDQKETSAWEKKMRALDFEETKEKDIFYFVLGHDLSYKEGLASARTKFRHDARTRYPKEEEAVKLLLEFRKEFTEPRPVACFINEEGTYVYLSKTGQPGKKVGEHPPVGTELYVAVVAEKE